MPRVFFKLIHGGRRRWERRLLAVLARSLVGAVTIATRFTTLSDKPLKSIEGLRRLGRTAYMESDGLDELGTPYISLFGLFQTSRRVQTTNPIKQLALHTAPLSSHKLF